MNADLIALMIPPSHTLMVHRRIDGSFTLSLCCSHRKRKKYIGVLKGHGESVALALEDLLQKIKEAKPNTPNETTNQIL